MSIDDIRNSASSTIGGFVRGETSLAQMTDSLEYVVEMAEEQADPATRDLSYL